MVKANLKALMEEFDCSGASIEQLYLKQDELQQFAVGTAGAVTDAAWMLQTTHVIESSGILNKAVLKWQARTTAYKTKARFIADFNKYHKEYFPCLRSQRPQLHTMSSKRTTKLENSVAS